MKRIRSLVTALVVLVFIFSVFAGCGAKQGTEQNAGSAAEKTADVQTTETVGATEAAQEAEDSFKDTMALSVATWDIENDIATQADDAVFQAIAKKFNVTIKPIGLTWDDYGQKIQVWASSGQLPDIFSIDAIGTQFYRNWIDQGVVKALPEDMGKYPNLAKYLESPDIKGLQEDGKFYCVPRKTYPSLDYNAVDRLVEYRWDLAQKAGVTKEPETWEEFKAMLKAIVQKDPEGKKIAGLTCVNVKQIGGFFWTYGNSAATSDGSGTDYKWIKEDGQFIPAVFSKAALPALQNMKDMYDQGLIDKDIALTKGDQGYDKFVSGKAAAVLHSGGYTTTTKKLYSDRWLKVNPDKSYSECIKALKPLKGPDGVVSHAVFKTYWSESYFNSKIEDAKMDRIMALYDFLVSDEGRDLLRWGIKDVDYKVEGDNYTVAGDGAVTLAEKYKAMAVFKALAEWDQGYAYNMNSPAIDKTIRKDAVDYMDWVIKNSKIPEFDIRLTYMSTPAKDKFMVLDHDDMLKVLLSKDSAEKAWTDIVNGYKAKGLDTVISEVNAKAKEMGIN
jgi:putative aldouronate transport system substrate-binding protein